jgi:integrase
LDYAFSGKRKTLSMGVYPDIGLADARDRRNEAKKLLANGIDPGAVRKAQKSAKQERAANSFEAMALEWFNLWKSKVAPLTAQRAWRNLELHVFPPIGKLPIAEIKYKTVAPVLQTMAVRGLGNSVEKVKTSISQIIRFAVKKELTEQVPDLRDSFEKVKEEHIPAITDPVKAGALMRAIEGYEGAPEVVAALKLLPLVFTRPGELRAAKWADIDLDKAEWKFITSKTKTEHLVPLAKQAVTILQDLHPISGHRELVFPGRDPKRPFSDVTINAALRRMGYDTKEEMTGHGFRAMARTMLAEQLGYQPEIIEHQLAHSVPDTLGTAYNRTKYLKDRREMMQAWADYLDKLKAGADVIPLRGNAA